MCGTFADGDIFRWCWYAYNLIHCCVFHRTEFSNIISANNDVAFHEGNVQRVHILQAAGFIAFFLLTAQ